MLICPPKDVNKNPLRGAQLHHVEEFKDVVTVEDLDGVCQGKEGIQRIEFEDRAYFSSHVDRRHIAWQHASIEMEPSAQIQTIIEILKKMKTHCSTVPLQSFEL